MTREEVYSWLVGVLTDLFELAPEKIRPEANLADLDLDSIDAVDVVAQFQKLTGKRMKPEAFKSVRTVDDVVSVLYALTKG
jgi:acyl carrier protein